MTISRIAHDGTSTDNTGALTISKALPSAVAVGDLLIAEFGWAQGGPGTLPDTVQDSLGNSYTNPTNALQQDAGNSCSAVSYYCISGFAGTPTVTATWSLPQSFRFVAFTGYHSTTGFVFDKAASALPAAANPASSGNIVVAVANSLLHGFCINTSTFSTPTAGTGFTSGLAIGDGSTTLAGATEWKVAAAGTDSVQFANPGTPTLAVIAMAFSPGSGGGGSVAPKESTQVLRQKRRTRKLRVIQIRAKRQANQAIRPVKRPLIVKGRRRKPQRTIKTTLVVAKRKGNAAHPPRVSPIVAKGRRRKPQRVLKVMQIRAKRLANLAIRPVKRPLVVNGRRRKPQRTLDTLQVRARRLAVPVPPLKVPDVFTVRPLKRARHKTATKIISGATRSVRPRAHITVISRRRLRPRTNATQIMAALLVETPAPRVGAAPMNTTLKKSKRPRKGRTIQLRSKFAGNQAVRPVKTVKVYTKKRRKRTGRFMLLDGAPRAAVVTPRKPTNVQTVVSAKRRRHREGTVSQLRGKGIVPPARVPVKQQVVIAAKRRRHRIGSVSQLHGKGVVPPTKRPTKPQTTVLVKKRKLRPTDVTQLRAKRSVVPTKRPRKAALQVETARGQSRRRHKKVTTVKILRAKKSSPKKNLGVKVKNKSANKLLAKSSSAPRITAQNTSAPRITVKDQP